MGTGNGSDSDDSEESNDSIQAEYDWEATKPSTAIVETVAAAARCEPTDINPLFGSVDPDAIDTLVMSGTGTQAPEVTLSLRLDDYEITVQRNGTIEVSPATETA